MVIRWARNADEIADLLDSARRRLTRPEWSGSTYSGTGPAPGVEFTRPLPRNRSGVPLQPLPKGAGFAQPEVRARLPRPDLSGPREIRFPRTSVRETGEEFTEYFPEVVNPLSGTTSDAIESIYRSDPTGTYLSAIEFIEDVSDPNDLYRAALLMRQLRPKLSRREMRVMERALEASALRVGIPPTTTMGPSLLFPDLGLDVPVRPEATFGNYGNILREIRTAAGGSVKKARKGGTVRLAALSIFDNGVDGGIIRNARTTGQITELEEARLYEQLSYWRNQVLEGAGIDPATINGFAGLRITDDMSEPEKYLRFSQAIRTANSPDEIAMIQAEIPGHIVSSSFIDTLADDMYAAMRRFESRGDMPESAAVTARRVYGQSDDLERGGLETFTPEEEFVVRSLPRGAGDAPPAIEGSLKDIAARVNQRLRRMGAEPLDRRAVRAIPLETSARGVNIEPSELTGGGSLPISVENWEMYRQIQARKGIKVPRNPEGYYRSGDYLLPRQSGAGAASGPSRAEGVGLGAEDINRAALEQIMEEGGAAGVGGTSPVRVSAEALADGSDVQRAWAARYGQARIDELESADPNVRRAAVRATQRGVQEGVISDRMLAELRAASVRSGITAKNPAGRGGPLRGTGRQPAIETAAVSDVSGWGRYPEGRPNFEVSTQGDRRFSAFNARIRGRGNKSIEDIYQIDIKGGEKLGPGKYSMKGRLPEGMTQEQAYTQYKQLWVEFFDENPELLQEAARLAQGKVITDRFANSPVSQARAIHEILEERGLRSLKTVSSAPVMSMPMNFTDGQGGRMMRPEFRGKSTMDLIISGDRTGTTRNSLSQFKRPDGKTLEVGDIVEFTDNRGRKVKVEVTKAPYQLPTSDDPATMNWYANTWSTYEGWSPEVYREYAGKWQIQYRVIG